MKHGEKKRVGKNVQRISEVWKNFNRSNICVITVPEREERKSQKKIFEEIMTKILPNLMKTIIP